MPLFVVRKQPLELQVPKKMALQVANGLFAISIWIGNRVVLFLIWRRKTFGSVDSDLTLSHSQMHLSQLVARKGKSNVRRRSLMKTAYCISGFILVLVICYSPRSLLVKNGFSLREFEAASLYTVYLGESEVYCETGLCIFTFKFLLTWCWKL